MLTSILALNAAGWTPLPLPQNAPALDRRAVLAGGLLGAASTILNPLAAAAKIDSVNPANNYYFPMAKYRYLPRICRAWIAVDQVSLRPAPPDPPNARTTTLHAADRLRLALRFFQLSGQAIQDRDWEGLQVIWERADDTVTAMPLFTSAVEGSRSTKRKKKSDEQKTMMKVQKDYKADCAKLQTAITKKDIASAETAIKSLRESLSVYRTLAKIDTADGGIIKLPEDEEYEGAGHAGAPLGYVVPAFRGGGNKKSDVRAAPAACAPIMRSPYLFAHISCACCVCPQYALR